MYHTDNFSWGRPNLLGRPSQVPRRKDFQKVGWVPMKVWVCKPLGSSDKGYGALQCTVWVMFLIQKTWKLENYNKSHPQIWGCLRTRGSAPCSHRIHWGESFIFENILRWELYLWEYIEVGIYTPTMNIYFDADAFTMLIDMFITMLNIFHKKFHALQINFQFATFIIFLQLIWDLTWRACLINQIRQRSMLIVLIVLEKWLLISLYSEIFLEVDIWCGTVLAM